jgi:hypothetical protein
MLQSIENSALVKNGETHSEQTSFETAMIQGSCNVPINPAPHFLQSTVDTNYQAQTKKMSFEEALALLAADENNEKPTLQTSVSALSVLSSKLTLYFFSTYRCFTIFFSRRICTKQIPSRTTSTKATISNSSTTSDQSAQFGFAEKNRQIH